MVARELGRQARQPAIQPLAMASGIDLGNAAFDFLRLIGLRLEVFWNPHPILRVHCSL